MRAKAEGGHASDRDHSECYFNGLISHKMYAHPGKKLLFMGSEIGQWNEWNHEWSVGRTLFDFDNHRGLQKYVRN